MIPHHAWVVLIRDDGTQALIRASKNAEVRSGHMRALGDQLVGHPYGSTFEFHNDKESATGEQVLPDGPQKSLESLNQKRAKKRKAPIQYSRLVRVKATEDAFAILKRDDGTGGGEEYQEAGRGLKGNDDDEEQLEGEEREDDNRRRDEEDDRDNRNYQANPQNQKADSLTLRMQGATGHEIVRALTENSVTFAQKNKFSQEKYLKRITTKHVPRVTVVRATSRTIAEVLFIKHQQNQGSDTIRGMRWVDTLPQMLAYGNVHSAAKCMVLDGVGGLLSLAVLERLREDQGGRCYFVGTTPREIVGGGGRPFIDLLNLPKKVLISRFVVCPSNRLNNGSIAEGTVEEPNLAEEHDDPRDAAAAAVDEIMKESNKGGDDEDVERDEDEEADGARPIKRGRIRLEQAEIDSRRELRKARQEEMFSILNVANGGDGADALLISARQDPLEALEVLLPHLGLGRPFVVHHPCIEPLMVARAKLAESKAVLDLMVTETFCREYQVLSNRTHPHMTGSAASGFILRGIKVHPWKSDQE